MIKKKRYIQILIAVLLLFQHHAFAQLYIRDTLSCKPGGILFVDGNVTYDDYGIFNQLIFHEGLIQVRGDWYNTSLYDTKAFASMSTGTVFFDGGLQTFNGVPTRFPSLTIGGSDKKLLYTNVEVSDVLNLTNKELDVNGNTIYVMSPNVNAIVFNLGGYINTSTSNASPDDAKNGWLIRNTLAANSNYEYPLGNASFQYKFRPLKLAAEKDGNIYTQFQNYYPGKDGYDTARFYAPEVGKINPLYYHSIKTDDPAGNNVMINAYPYSKFNDGIYGTLVQWDSTSTPQGRWALLPSDGPFPSSYYTTDNLFTSANSLAISTKKAVINLGNKVIVPQLIIPNVFTPDGDGVNETFVIRGLDKFVETNITIFNRWNNVVYQSKDYQSNWDGRGLNDGVYFYVLNAKSADGKWYVYRGDIMIMRK